MDLEYGIIGNCKTVALVSSDASIDWLCLPRFDSPSIFAKILDEKKGGSFSIKPAGTYESRQEYVKDTNVLRTVFESDSGTFEVTDFFPHYLVNGNLIKESEMYRVIKVLSGSPEAFVSVQPRFEYASERIEPKVAGQCVSFVHGTDSLYIYTNLNVRDVVSGKKTVLKGESYIILSYNKIEEGHSAATVKQELSRTISYWRNWLEDARLP